VTRTGTQIDGQAGIILWHVQDGSYVVLLREDGRCYRVGQGEYVWLPF
jgi:hypothetical protein